MFMVARADAASLTSAPVQCFPAAKAEWPSFNTPIRIRTAIGAARRKPRRHNNDDKEIQTHFLTLGLQYMFNRNWGIQAEVPYDFRYFKTKDDAGDIVSRNWSQLGDVRIEGIYTGFFPDLSAGVTFGLKLPTGSHTFDPDVVDRDTQIGTGSTDLLLGGFYRDNLTRDNQWDWFAQLQLDVPALIQDQYRPGVELDTAAGIDYKGFSLGRVRIITPGTGDLFRADQ